MAALRGRGALIPSGPGGDERVEDREGVSLQVVGSVWVLKVAGSSGDAAMVLNDLRTMQAREDGVVLRLVSVIHREGRYGGYEFWLETVEAS